MRRALEIVTKALTELGGKLEDVIMTRLYVANEQDIESVAVVHGETFRDIRPASTIVKVGFVDPRILVEIEAEAVVGPAQ
jgi:enamine deaminase RidA (YjgF/YER057c/UK114 family)